MRTIVKSFALFFVLLGMHVYAGDSPPPGRGPESDSGSSNNTPTPMPKVYKWIDEKGITHYGDQPPSENVEPINLPPIEVMENTTTTTSTPDGTVADPSTTVSEVDNPERVDQSTNANSPTYQLNITAPQNNETVIRSQEGTVFIALSLDVPLLQDHRISMSVDGKEITIKNSGAVNISVTQGNHTVQAIVIDSSNNVLAHSNTVAFKAVNGHWLQQKKFPTPLPLPTILPTPTMVPIHSHPPMPPTEVSTKRPKPTRTPQPVPFINNQP